MAQKREKSMTNCVLIFDGIPTEKDTKLEVSVLKFFNEHYKTSSGAPFQDGDIHAAYHIGKEGAAKRSLKVVFDNAWYRRNIFEQREKWKVPGVYMREEPTPIAEQMGYQAREARRRGTIKKCKTGGLGALDT